MEKEKIYKEIVRRCKDQGIMERHYGVEELDPYFTDSQETDIREMINDGFTADEIIDNIKLWYSDDY